jgi:hypothetical protein
MAGTNFIESYAEFLKSIMPIMEDWTLISRYQKIIFNNFSNMFFGNELLHSFFQLAPSYLSQVINPWSFSLMQFTKEVKGSPELEYKILTKVDGYGGQLGTIIDYLEMVSGHLQLGQLTDEETYKSLRFKNLANEINDIKNSG